MLEHHPSLQRFKARTVESIALWSCCVRAECLSFRSLPSNLVQSNTDGVKESNKGKVCSVLFWFCICVCGM